MGLFRKECSLCGGRLHNNICVECGLDNSKSDENYISTGKTHQDSESLTHVHTEQDPLAGKIVTKDFMKQAKERQKKKESYAKQNSYRPNTSQGTVKGAKKKSKIGIVIVIIVILASIVPAFREVADELSYGTREPEYVVMEDTVWEEDPYAYVTRELAPTGMIYEIDLTAGTYKGGVHIPEGTYEVVFVPEEGSDNSYADLSMNDMENGIYQSFYFGDSEQLYAIDDFRIYTNGMVDIEGRGTLHFYSENAQPQEMFSMINPNTEEYYLENAFVAGEDIVPGVYDVYCESGSGIFDYEVENGYGYTGYYGKLIGDQESGFAGSLKNIVLPEGTEVYIDGMSVRLIPSSHIQSEEYWAYYDNY